jgi:hypothetical protein
VLKACIKGFQKILGLTLYLSKQGSYNTLNNKIMPLKVLNDSMFVKPCNFLNIDRVVDMKPDYRGW